LLVLNDVIQDLFITKLLTISYCQLYISAKIDLTSTIATAFYSEKSVDLWTPDWLIPCINLHNC